MFNSCEDDAFTLKKGERKKIRLRFRTGLAFAQNTQTFLNKKFYFLPANCILNTQLNNVAKDNIL